MDEQQAWASFAQTGKIEDYIRYTQLRDQARAQGVACHGEEIHRAGKDPGAYHPGAGHWGE